MFTKGEWKAWRFSKYHNWKVSMGGRNEFLDLGVEEESEANAQLIASAPALYEALKRAQSRLELLGGITEGYKLERQIASALAKAEK